MLDMHGVTSDKVTSDLVHVGHHLLVSIRLRVAFPPTIETYVCVDFHKTEVFASAGMDEKMFHVGNFHDVIPP